MDTLEKLRTEIDAMRGCAHITDALLMCIIKTLPRKQRASVLRDFLGHTEDTAVMGMFSSTTSEATLSAMQENRANWQTLLTMALQSD
jgi:lipoate-protein ligase A